jgi:hypothetical protein
MTFKQEFPGLLGLPFVVNTNWLKKNREKAVEFVAAVLKTNADSAESGACLCSSPFVGPGDVKDSSFCACAARKYGRGW